MKKYSLAEIAGFLNAELVGDPKFAVDGILPIDKAGATNITFLENNKYRGFLDKLQAGAVILRAEDADLTKTNKLIVKDPYLAYARISALFNNAPAIKPGIHPTAVIGNNCQIDPTASIGSYVVIGDNVIIGNAALIDSGVTLYHGVKVGARTIIHSGAVIGADGFGMANENGKWLKIYQLGGVVIGDDVEIGANTTIDRGALNDTIIGNGVKLDNQIQIGHNVEIGDHTAIAGCTGIAGSTVIGKHCMIAGGVGINGHIQITDGVIVTAMSGVEKSILEPGMYSSALTAQPHLAWWRILTRLLQIDKLAKRVKELEKKLM